ncbi:hypothetical protein GCM10008023_41080 [Sphingomonas glacialis]|uniref:Histidine phosphatase family protein n=1 Tax=Sphingomonas glacialis TaxID=658225 RepID=A0ABQ3LXZ9_9SPHN|nr:hypothetical protein GCM10008023_41080 [Sphingomonas glacialis]
MVYDTRGYNGPRFDVYLSQGDWHIRKMMDDDDEVGSELLEFIFGMYAPQIVKLRDNRSVIVSHGDTLWGFEEPIGRVVFCDHVPRTLH